MQRLLRILVISYEYPPVGGGGSDVCHHIARGLAQKGHCVRVLTAHCGDLPFFERVDGYDVRRIRCFRRRAGGCSIPEMFAFVGLACLHGVVECLRFKPDLLHVHHAMPDGPAGYLLGLISRKPYVITAHGCDVPGMLPSLDAFFRRIESVGKLVWRKAAANVVVADHLLDLARRSYPDARIVYIPNGVDTEAFRPASVRPCNSEVRIVYAGRFHHEKNVAMLIRAVPDILALATRPFRVYLYGSGQEGEELVRLASELNVASRVEFPGWVERGKIVAAFQQGDIFCLPSLLEGMPIACIQAMACGLPVVATDTPGARIEVVDGRTGYLVPVNDTKALAQALAALIDSPEKRAAFGAAGRERCEEQFSWRRVGDLYHQLFLEVVSR